MRILFLPALLLIVACQPSTPAPTPVAAAPEPAAPTAESAPSPATTPIVASPAMPGPPTKIPDAWVGKWIGPEGTFLELARTGTGYAVTIQSLDGLARFDGNWAGDRIAFSRGGQAESIHASNGAETGMKWLADKKDCLTVKTGEGFCRD